MEILNKTFIIILLSGALSASAQNSVLETKFGKSYEFEIVKKYDDAINILKDSYTADSYELNLRMGWLHYLNGKNKESIEYYQKAIKLMPAAIEPIWAIITPLSVMENWVEVEKFYLAILKIDSKNSTANYNLGSIYYYRKNYVVAKKYLDVSLNLFPFNYDNLILSAWTNYYLGNKNDARILFNKTLLYKSGDASAMEGLSLLK